jgi:sulfur transfer protein SufE
LYCSKYHENSSKKKTVLLHVTSQKPEKKDTQNQKVAEKKKQQSNKVDGCVVHFFFVSVGEKVPGLYTKEHAVWYQYKYC